VNLVLLAVLIACALSLVTSRHHSRKLTTELAREQVRARAYETEYGQLSLEQSTWAMPARVEKIAREKLKLQHAGPGRVEIVELPGATSAAGPSQGANRSPSGGSAAASAASVGVVNR
jgi:cell division protein FtsL